MSFKWNVYKVFKNGKRAKAPVHQFEHDGDSVEALDYFKKNLVEKIGAKNRGRDFIVVDASRSQTRLCESVDEEEKLFLMKKNRVLIIEAHKRKLDIKKGYRGALVMMKETDWKWQWALLEGGTSNFRGAISEKFNTYPDAMTWINQQINHL